MTGDPEAAEGRLLHEFLERRLAGDTVEIGEFVRQHASESTRLERHLHAVSLLVGDIARMRRTLREIERLQACTIVSWLGAGGMGEVWLAEQGGRRVALKTLRSLSATERDALVREVEAAARLDHPWIVKILSFHRDDPPHLVMEFVDGIHLWNAVDAIKEKAAVTRVRTVVTLFAKMCDALEHAHAKGVVHGDLKPENVLVDGDLNPHLLDFGLSRLGGTVSAEVQGGTRGYSPPERSAPDGEVGPWSDTYSLCVMLDEALAAVLDRSARVLRSILRKGLRANPRRRHQSAAGLARDLRRWLRIPWLHPAVSVRNAVKAAGIVGVVLAVTLLLRPKPADAAGDLAHELWSARTDDDQRDAARSVWSVLEGSDETRQVEALRTAGALLRGEYSPRFLELARSTNSDVAAWALWCLGRSVEKGNVTDPAILSSCTQLAADSFVSPDPPVRRMAASLAGWLRCGDHAGLLKQMEDEDRPPALFALVRSRTPEDEAFIRELAFAKRDKDAARFLIEDRPDLADDLWQALLPSGSAERDCFPDWMHLSVCAQQASTPTRERICSLLMQAGEPVRHDPSLASRTSTYNAVRTLGNFGRAAFTVAGKGLLSWLEECLRVGDASVQCAAAEAIVRVLAKENAAPSVLVKRPEFERAAALLQQQVPGDARVPFTLARMHAWVGDWDGARTLALMAVEQGFRNPSELNEEPFSQRPDLVRELRARCDRERVHRSIPAQPARRDADAEVRELLVAGTVQATGWDAEITNGGWDPTHVDEWIVFGSYTGAVRLSFRLDHIPGKARLHLRMRAYRDASVPPGGYAEISLEINGRAVALSPLTVHEEGITLENVSSYLKEGPNEILLRTGNCITMAGLKSIELKT